MWADRKVIVAVAGGVSCYKSATLVSQLVQSNASVRVIMTESATRFVGPLTFQSLSGQTVLTNIWQSDEHPESQHIGLAQWCDIMIIAPATANMIAKLAMGLTDDVVSLTASALPQTTPLLLAPAMNAEMWGNPILKRNLATVQQIPTCHTIGPEEGWQACRNSGPGRMSEPLTIVEAAIKLLII